MSSKNNKGRKERPIVVVSIGPYGAYPADSAEYVGYYNVPESKLKSFHEFLWEILAGTSVNLFACETIPSFKKAEVLLDILRQTPEIYAWLSFSCLVTNAYPTVYYKIRAVDNNDNRSTFTKQVEVNR